MPGTSARCSMRQLLYHRIVQVAGPAAPRYCCALWRSRTVGDRRCGTQRHRKNAMPKASLHERIWSAEHQRYSRIDNLSAAAYCEGHNLSFLGLDLASVPRRPAHTHTLRVIPTSEHMRREEWTWQMRCRQ